MPRTKSDVVELALAEVRPHRGNPWRALHTAVLVVIAMIGVSLVLLPADSAATFGRVILTGDNALYLRAGVTIFPLFIALAVRAHPWPYTLLCVVFSLFGVGQIWRAAFSPALQGIALTHLVLDLGIIGFCVFLAWRPSVYERLEDTAEALRDAQGENARLRAENDLLRGGGA